MTEFASLSIEDRIAFICIANPPVNALSPPVVAAIGEALARVESDQAIDALVIHCAGSTFVAGADVAAFRSPDFSTAGFVDIFDRIESLNIPVIAALHGTALGGGLELALACHYRVAHPDSFCGLPEVKLGLLPGARGTQRLPRLTSISFALEVMLSGRRVSAREAAQAGLIDEICVDDSKSAGRAAARALVHEGYAIRRAGGLEMPKATEEVLGRFRELAQAKSSYPAHLAIVRCIEAGLRSFAEGAAAEDREFAALLKSPQSRSLRHLFFAERDARKIPGLPTGQTLRPIDRVGVVGAGTMGGGIAMCFANAGIPVVIVETNHEALERGLGIVRRNYEASAAKGRISIEQVARRMALLSGALDYGALGDCDLVIEAVFEDLDLKKRICVKLGEVARPGAVIASNTSTLDIDELAAASGRPADFVGMHFFSPANIMRLLEVVRGRITASDVLATAVKLARRIAKTPVVTGVCYGFIGNRMAEVYMRETEFLLMEGAAPAQIDGAAEALGMAMGPCRMLDLAGIDVGARTVLEWQKSGRAPKDPSYRAVVASLSELGRLGQKTGAGYYRYSGRTAQNDPEVSALVRSIGAGHGIVRRTDIAPDEIVERLFYPMINEGFRILDEGIAYRPGDIDVVWVAGYGFPDHLGGPMHWADRIGLLNIANRLAHYAALRGNAHGYWTPAKLLTELASDSQVPRAAPLQ